MDLEQACWQCGHAVGWHPYPSTKSAENCFGCLDCSCELDASDAAAIIEAERGGTE